jgi:hypothetical protein
MALVDAETYTVTHRLSRDGHIGVVFLEEPSVTHGDRDTVASTTFTVKAASTVEVLTSSEPKKMRQQYNRITLISLNPFFLFIQASFCILFE